MRLLPILLLAAACSSHPHRDPTGEAFPSVQGEALDGAQVRIPDDFRGEPVLLLVAYKQKTQFDVDRWVLGILQAGIDVRVVEVPTVRGWVPRLFAGQIDEGMRSGIPREEWGSVVTVYGDAADVARFTGDEGRNARVLLLDGEGRVVFFHDRGYSPATFLRLRDAAQALRR